MTDIAFIILLFTHIVTVVLWMGASILFVSVLTPSMTKMAPSSRMDFFKSVGPAYQRFVVGTATVAVVAGLILYAYVNGNIVQVSNNVVLNSSGMPWILVGIIFGLAAYIVGIGVVMRASQKLLRLISQTPAAQAGPPSPEMQALLRRLSMSSRIQALLLALALVSMVVGANSF